MKTQLNPANRIDPAADTRTRTERDWNPSSVLYSLSFTQIAVAGRPLTARAAANIAEWSTYLPQDCVAAMIRDGWHLTV
jgi:hypothetical protein